MKKNNYCHVLAIAGSDSGGCAGIQADLRVLNHLACHGSTAITAITAQNTIGVQDILPMPAEIVYAQLQSISSDMKIDAIKIGMLFNQEIIQVVAKFCQAHTSIPIIVDPVCAASSGDGLLQEDALEVLIDTLFPLAWLITPNKQEANFLLQQKDTKNDKTICDVLNVKNCLITGGDTDGQEVIDQLHQKRRSAEDFQECISYKAPKIQTFNNHGSGCSLSTAIAVYLAQGLILSEAIASAINLVRFGLKNGANYKLGCGAGPLHFT